MEEHQQPVRRGEDTEQVCFRCPQLGCHANLIPCTDTHCSLSLVFALHHYKPTPLYVMDEIDAALGEFLVDMANRKVHPCGPCGVHSLTLLGRAAGQCARRASVCLSKFEASWVGCGFGFRGAGFTASCSALRLFVLCLELDHRLQERVHRGPLHQGAHTQRAGA